MKIFLKISTLILSALVLISCKKDKITLPIITTAEVTDISYTIATSGGDVTDEGGVPVISRGVCWNTSEGPTIANSKTIESGGLGFFLCNITQLNPNTLYHLRAYAMNSFGIGYGNEITFTTKQTASATLTTTPVTLVSQKTAASGGNILSENGGNVTERGVCWSLSISPTIRDSRTIDGTGKGSYTSNLTSLQPGTTYYIRAYATNSAGTSYGNEISFTTNQATIPILVTATATSITQNTSTCGGTVISDGEASILARGVCWNTYQTPTLSDSKTSDGSETGSFTSTLTDLIGNTTYYVRAYATNNVGTGYGNQISFKTSPVLPTLTTTPVSSIAFSSAVSGGNITSDGGAPVTIRGVCWALSALPTVGDNFTTDGVGIGSFVSELNLLSTLKTYYLRAYATNSVGTAYGNQEVFTAKKLTIPEVSTTNITLYTSNSVTAGGFVSKDGNDIVTDRGVYWGTSQNPEITGTKLQIGAGTGSFSANILGLNSNTTYYVRAYASNSAGTGFGNELSVILWMNYPSAGVTDVDGNSYNSVKIGNQVWMTENLKTTRYSDGSDIALVNTKNAWTSLVWSSKAYCWFGDDISNKDKYGALYTWNAAMNGANASSTIPSRVQGVCPTGWHLPSAGEWEELITFLGGSTIAGGKLKDTGETNWASPNPATNESGFTGIAAGMRDGLGNFFDEYKFASWWGSTDWPLQKAYMLYCSYLLIKSSLSIDDMDSGHSVRCVRD